MKTSFLFLTQTSRSVTVDQINDCVILSSHLAPKILSPGQKVPAMSLYATYLPRGLLDLTFGRKYNPCLNAFRTASTSGNLLGRTCNMHSAAALATLPPEPPALMESLKPVTVGRYVLPYT